MKELALHVLDIAQNSISAGASKILLDIHIEEKSEKMTVGVTDNGKGMDVDELEKVKDPFYTSRTTRSVGLGIPLLAQHAEMTGGKMLIRSEKGEGTKVEAQFLTKHPDIQPIGDIEGCWTLLAASYPDIDVILQYRTENGDYDISSKSVMDYLGLNSLSGSENMRELRRMIRNNIEDISLGLN